MTDFFRNDAKMTTAKIFVLSGVLFLSLFAFFGCGGGGGGGNPVAPVPPATTTTPDITGPASGSIFAPGSNIVISVDLKAEAGNVTKVEFYQGLVKIGESVQSPFSFVWTTPPPGSYTLTIRAYNSAGAILVSKAVPVSVAGSGQQTSGPVVFITQPVSGAIFAFNASSGIVISASASRRDGVINKVEFYSGPLLLGQASSPFSISWIPPLIGTYSLIARAFDNWGMTATSPVVSIIVASAINATQTAVITHPLSNASFSAGASITITVQTYYFSDLIDRVEFYQGSNKIGETLYSPTSSSTYSMAWPSVPIGSYTLSAKVIDQFSRVTLTSPVYISVNAVQNSPPAITLSQPTTNQTFPFASNITLIANASDSDGSVDLVEFFQGATKIGEARSAPFTYVWPAVQAGVYTLSAKATDNNGAAATSALVSITVSSFPNQPPTVALTAPADGAHVNEGTNITLAATAGDADGNVVKVEFLASTLSNTILLGESRQAPYSYDWIAVPSGTFSVFARATDNSGATATSSLASLIVNPAPTVVLRQPANLATFTQDDAIDFLGEATDTDGIVKMEFYANGIKLGEDAWPPFTYRWINPSPGKQFLQATAIDSLGAIGRSATATVWVNIPPTIAFTLPLDRTGFLLGTDVAMTVNAVDSDGAISSVEFFVNGVSLAKLNGPPYAYSWHSPASGSYVLTAKATDNMGASRTSSPINIVVRDTTPPTIVINGGDSFTNSHNVELTVNAAGQSAMWLSQDGTFTGIASEAPAAPPAVRLWSFPATAGKRTIYARFMDPTGIYRYAQDDIDVMGPTNASVSTRDIQPVNQGFVNLDLNAVGATEMLVQLDVNDATPWRAYQSKLTVVLPAAGGNQTIYTKFRNAGGVETAELTLPISVSSTAPSGNKAEFHTGVDPASQLVTSVNVGSLPVYLHFSIADTKTASIAYALLYETQPNPVWPTDYTIVGKSTFAPVKISKTTTPSVQEGQNILWYRFADGVGNWTDSLVTSLNVSPLPVSTATIQINSGDAYTSFQMVKLAVNAPGQSIMWLSNDGSFSGASPFSPPSSGSTVNWALPAAAGKRNVYARFQNASGTYSYAQAAIEAVGPASTSISTRDVQPINGNYVNLVVSAAGASHMLITEDVAALNASTDYEPFRYSKILTSLTGGGTHTIYAKFITSFPGGIESAPVSMQVSVRSSAPTGNTAVFKDSAALNASAVATVGLGSLPVFLHFTINDASTATVSYKLTNSAAPVPTDAELFSVTPPVSPKAYNTGDFPGNGVFNFWYKFSDAVGNSTPLQVTWIDVQGPSLRISPAAVSDILSGQTQQFSATLKNYSGTIKWKLDQVDLTGATYGRVDSDTGMYTAPNPIRTTTSLNVIAFVSENNSVSDQVSIRLRSKIAVKPSFDSWEASLGGGATIAVRFENTVDGGIILSQNPPTSGGGGKATISAPQVDPLVPTDSIATVSYVAPVGSTPYPNPVTITIAAATDTATTANVSVRVRNGGYISIYDASATLRLRTGSQEFTSIPSEIVPGGVVWQAVNGFLDAGRTTTTLTTLTSPYKVTFYAPNSAIGQGELIASFQPTIGLATYISAIINFSPAINLEFKQPKNVSLTVASSTGVQFSTQYTGGTPANTQVKWEFKGASDVAWSLPGTNVNGGLSDTGFYTPPSTMPSNPDIYVRVTSVEEPTASDVAIITLKPAIVVIIHQGYNAAAAVCSIATATLEVGQVQFFGEVQNATNLTVSWFVESISGGNSTYGTVDATGNYSAPDTLTKSEVELKAVSNQDPTVFATCTINLENFWTQRSENLHDVTNATYSIYSLIIDPTTASTSDKRLFTGTNGHGLYRAGAVQSVTGTDWDSIPWLGETGLFNANIGLGGEYVVNKIAISLQHPTNLVAGTSSGTFISTDGINFSSVTMPLGSSDRTAPGPQYDVSFTNIVNGVVIDPRDDRYMYALGKNQGVLRFFRTNSASPYVYNGTLFDDKQPLSYVQYVPKTWLDGSGTSHLYQEPVSYESASNTVQLNCITIDPQFPDTLYVGFSKYLQTAPDGFQNGYIKFNNARTSHYYTRSGTSPTFYRTGDPPAGNTAVTFPIWKSLNSSYILYFDSGSSIILSMAVDPNIQTTLWTGKNDGIFRSTNDGISWASVGAYANVRDILIDPINTVSAYIATENGLYKTANSGTNWKQIKSGLEGHTTINALSLSPGGWGTRRIFSGTTSGLYMGVTTLDF
ncbi:MAG: hypothetical protein HQM09_02490 [Candidatus Riflebacteria bacterium]|nr:hypothetical protein [Candidatus Riflebacteria bacterium]